MIYVSSHYQISPSLFAIKHVSPFLLSQWLLPKQTLVRYISHFILQFITFACSDKSTYFYIADLLASDALYSRRGKVLERGRAEKHRIRHPWLWEVIEGPWENSRNFDYCKTVIKESRLGGTRKPVWPIPEETGSAIFLAANQPYSTVSQIVPPYSTVSQIVTSYSAAAPVAPSFQVDRPDSTINSLHTLQPAHIGQSVFSPGYLFFNCKTLCDLHNS